MSCHDTRALHVMSSLFGQLFKPFGFFPVSNFHIDIEQWQRGVKIFWQIYFLPCVEDDCLRLHFLLRLSIWSQRPWTKARGRLIWGGQYRSLLSELFTWAVGRDTYEYKELFVPEHTPLVEAASWEEAGWGWDLVWEAATARVLALAGGVSPCSRSSQRRGLLPGFPRRTSQKSLQGKVLENWKRWQGASYP